MKSNLLMEYLCILCEHQSWLPQIYLRVGYPCPKRKNWTFSWRTLRRHQLYRLVLYCGEEIKNHVPKETQASVVHIFSLLESLSSERIQNRNESFIFDLAIYRNLSMRCNNAGCMVFLLKTLIELTILHS